MPRSLFNGDEEFLSGSITRLLLNTQTAGKAVIAKVVGSSNITLTQTGADSGTGDVTLYLTANPSISGQLTVAGATFNSAYINSAVNFGNGFGAQALLARPLGTAQGQLGGIAFGATFQTTIDNGVRRAADIYAGFNGGSWGAEYLSIAVGSGGANDDAANVTIEQIRITDTQVLGRATTASSSTTTGALVLAGGVGVAGALNVGGTSAHAGAASFASTLSVTGATTLAALTSSAIIANGTVTSQTSGVGSTIMSPGSAANPGYLAFYNTTSRVGYIGWQAPTSNYLALETENGFLGYEVTGNLKVDGAATFASAPVLSALSGLVRGNGASAATAVNFVSAALTVTAANTLSALPSTPLGLFYLILVNGQAFLSAGSTPPFTVSGTTVTWSAANAKQSIDVVDDVKILYI